MCSKMWICVECQNEFESAESYWSDYPPLCSHRCRMARNEAPMTEDQTVAYVGRYLGIASFVPHGVDREDFRELHIQSIEEALRRAYQAGRMSHLPDTRPTLAS